MAQDAHAQRLVEGCSALIAEIRSVARDTTDPDVKIRLNALADHSDTGLAGVQADMAAAEDFAKGRTDAFAGPGANLAPPPEPTTGFGDETPPADPADKGRPVTPEEADDLRAKGIRVDYDEKTHGFLAFGEVPVLPISGQKDPSEDGPAVAAVTPMDEVPNPIGPAPAMETADPTEPGKPGKKR